MKVASFNDLHELCVQRFKMRERTQQKTSLREVTFVPRFVCLQATFTLYFVSVPNLGSSVDINVFDRELNSFFVLIQVVLLELESTYKIV